MDSLIDFVKLNTNVREKNFLEAVALTVLSMIALSLLPHLQYKYKLLSRMTNGDMKRAADFLALILIHMGTFKNYAFFEALFNNESFSVDQWYYFSIMPLGGIFILAGGILVIFSFKKLGLRGMYFGDHFGFLLDKRVNEFPYNYLQNPQYVGTNMVYLGLSLLTRSFTGIVLTGFVIFMYEIFWLFMESKKLNEFYPDAYDSDVSSGSTDLDHKQNNKIK